jgi:hypothetical protein
LCEKFKDKKDFFHSYGSTLKVCKACGTFFKTHVDQIKGPFSPESLQDYVNSQRSTKTKIRLNKALYQLRMDPMLVGDKSPSLERKHFGNGRMDSRESSPEPQEEVPTSHKYLSDVLLAHEPMERVMRHSRPRAVPAPYTVPAMNIAPKQMYNEDQAYQQQLALLADIADLSSISQQLASAASCGPFQQFPQFPQYQPMSASFSQLFTPTLLPQQVQQHSGSMDTEQLFLADAVPDVDSLLVCS